VAPREEEEMEEEMEEEVEMEEEMEGGCKTIVISSLPL
jgi:hypothetical protein